MAIPQFGQHLHVGKTDTRTRHQVSGAEQLVKIVYLLGIPSMAVFLVSLLDQILFLENVYMITVYGNVFQVDLHIKQLFLVLLKTHYAAAKLLKVHFQLDCIVVYSSRIHMTETSLTRNGAGFLLFSGTEDGGS